METWLGMKVSMVSRGDGATAALRSAYQAGGAAVDPSGVARSRILAPGEHRGQWVLLPKDAPDRLLDPEQLWAEAARAERQWNAQEARVLDIQILRGFPEAAIEDLVQAIYAPFVEGGLAVQVDLHVSPARDGGLNRHFHGLISTRTTGPNGFAQTKTAARAWNTIFREDGGRGMRRKVAAAVNSVAEKLGLDLRVDPRTNAERGLPVREPRLPRSVFRAPGTAYARKKLADLDRHRVLRGDWNQAAQKVRRTGEVFETIERAVFARRAAMPSIAPSSPTLQDDQLVEACERAVDFARLFGAPDMVVEVGQANVVFISCAGAEISVEAGRAYVDGPLNETVSDFLGELAADLGWERVEVSGGAAPQEQAILRNSVRRMSKRLDPKTFQINALHADPDVADALKICATAISGSAQPERALLHFLDTRHVTKSTQRVVAALVSESDLSATKHDTLDFWDLYRARLELGAQAVNIRAETLRTRNTARIGIGAPHA